ncbi:hypothetical protein DV704_06795 [Meiothermus sp. QL-1]|uniref:hypothetical protein n=1 Tax=Meiothermus sp. QL-1 TaxID=2058095 RepID=UPI000E0A0B74|nr:hypothetical protein [Meiothermus sp. QL-1]RDI95580.1 hypothetical protein DV704_06795 [Meiothermus sp. QL-1]
METLGHYWLRGRLGLLEESGVEVWEGQDTRTGLEVLAFRPLDGTPPKLPLAHALPWVDALEATWVAEVPAGAVQAVWLSGQVEPARLVRWVRQLLEVLEGARAQDIPIGYICPELLFTRGSRVWLAGVGVPHPGRRWDYGGFLQTVRAMAGELYPALPWREALEGYATGQLEAGALRAALEAATAELPPVSAALPVVEVAEPLERLPDVPPPKRIRVEEEERLEPPPPRPARRRWLWLLPLPLLLGLGLWWRGQTAPSAQPTQYPVEFRLEPPGARARIVVLEAPEGSRMPLGSELAEVPGAVVFDKPGVYRIRVLVAGRPPVESLIEVPHPGGVTIALR